MAGRAAEPRFPNLMIILGDGARCWTEIILEMMSQSDEVGARTVRYGVTVAAAAS